jgi:predicted patatin/cPLA2 family phospholipase
MNVLVVEGGALRSVYSAGILDGFLQRNFNPFDLAIGVSAGASNLLFYLSNEKGQSIKLFRQAVEHSEFINYWRFLRGGHLLDMDWLFSQPEVTHFTTHLNFNLKCPLLIGLTEVSTGKSVYLQCSQQNYLNALKASMSLPLLYRSFPVISGQAMTDGGIADGIPVAEAIKQGASKIMLIRSRHQNYKKNDTLWHRLIRWKLREHKALVETMEKRVNIHQQTCQLISHPPENVSIIDICPPENFSMHRFSKAKDELINGYQSGFDFAGQIIQLWQNSN